MAVETPARIAVLGAGPIGLEAALYARSLGYDVDVFERGRVAENILRWSHVRMFSPFAMNRSTLGLAALAAQDEGYDPPSDVDLLTGREWAEQYLIPLSQTDLIADCIHQDTQVVSVGRENWLKAELPGSDSRADSSFKILVCAVGGSERCVMADVVIDTTGVFGNANWLGRGGIPAIGEQSLRGSIEFGLPNILGSDRERYVDKRTLVIGSGYSAATNVVTLARLASESESTSITWITRHERRYPINTIPNDRLEERDELAQAVNRLANDDESPITYYPGTVVEELNYTKEKFNVEFSGQLTDAQQFDQIIANVGFRPDHTIYEELQVHLCYATSGPIKLAAAMLGQESADCLDQTSCGVQTLINPEPNFYILGSKSYGRSSNFLVSTGLQQIREVFTIIGGREDLDLYASVEHLLT